MGIRATIVIAGEPAECYSQKGGQFLDRDLMVAGPETFRSRFAFEQSRRPDIVDSFNASEHWGSAETGVFIDETRKLLLVDGGEQARWDPDWAEVSLSLIRARWADWDVRWFAQEWEFVAQLLGVPCTYGPTQETASTNILAWQPEDPGPDWIRQLRVDPRYLSFERTVISVRRNGVTRLALIKSRVIDVVGRGQSIVEDDGWKRNLTLGGACTEALHLDYDETTFSYFGHRRAMPWAPRRVFPDWTEERLWSAADFERRVGPMLRVERIGREALLRQVVAAGCAENSHLESEVIPGLVLDLGYEDLAFDLAETLWPWTVIASPPHA